MITLTFLICTLSGECVQNAPPQVFQSMAQCEATAMLIKDGVQRGVDNGTTPRHYSKHKCIDWGVPS